MFDPKNFDLGNNLCTMILLTMLATVFASFSLWYFNFEYFRLFLILSFLTGFVLVLNFLYTLQLSNPRFNNININEQQRTKPSIYQERNCYSR